MEILEQGGDPEEFLEHAKLEMFANEVYAFTPKGELIALPGGATLWTSPTQCIPSLATQPSVPRSMAATGLCEPACTTAMWFRSSRRRPPTSSGLGGSGHHRSGPCGDPQADPLF
jgi:hypothetical protein